MKPLFLQCFKLAPIHFLIIFLSFIVEVWCVALLLSGNIWLTLLSFVGLAYILFAQIKLTTNIVDLTTSVIEAGRRKTGLFFKDGTPQYVYTDYVMLNNTILLILAVIVGVFTLGIML